jgi:hypothetical protein
MLERPGYATLLGAYRSFGQRNIGPREAGLRRNGNFGPLPKNRYHPEHGRRSRCRESTIVGAVEPREFVVALLGEGRSGEAPIEPGRCRGAVLDTIRPADREVEPFERASMTGDHA